MFPGMDKRQVEQAMRKMGVKQVVLPATQVIIKLPDKDLIIERPEVMKVNMMGQESFQIVGDITERAHSSEPDINDEDVETVMGQAGVSKEDALKAIKAAKGDLAQAILDLKN